MSEDLNRPRDISVEIFSQPSPTRARVNEDAWIFFTSPGVPETVVFGVIDGAGVRRSLPVLSEKIRERFPKLTPAAFASHILKTSAEEQLRKEPRHPLRNILIKANDVLRDEITRIIGTFDAEKIVKVLGEPFSDDPRNVRLILPTCVVTLARLDLDTSRLEFAHVGDTSLFELFNSGDIVRHTRDQMGPFDFQALESARTLQYRRQIQHFSDVVSGLDGREFIVQSGLRLNYVDDDGMTVPGQGCGAVNGLPEMEDYIETGVVDIDVRRTRGFLLLSDGLELLSPLYENPIEREHRYERMGRIVCEAGLRGLYEEMKQMASSDIHLDRYPRTKVQDDATGIYLELGKIAR